MPVLDRHFIPGLNRCCISACGFLINRDYARWFNISGICHRRAGTAFLALGWYLAALVVILLNRLLEVWTVRWRGAEGLPTRAAFLNFSRFSFLRAGTFWVYPRRTQQNALAGGWLLFAFIGTGSSFSLLLRWRRNIRLIIPVMRKIVLLSGRVNRRHRNDLTVCLGCLFPAWFAWFAWIFGALCG